MPKQWKIALTLLVFCLMAWGPVYSYSPHPISGEKVHDCSNKCSDKCDDLCKAIDKDDEDAYEQCQNWCNDNTKVHGCLVDCLTICEFLDDENDVCEAVLDDPEEE